MKITSLQIFLALSPSKTFSKPTEKSYIFKKPNHFMNFGNEIQFNLKRGWNKRVTDFERRNILSPNTSNIIYKRGGLNFDQKIQCNCFATRNCLRHEFLEWFRNSLFKDPMLIVQNLYYSYSTFFFFKLPTSKLPVKI